MPGRNNKREKNKDDLLKRAQRKRKKTGYFIKGLLFLAVLFLLFVLGKEIIYNLIYADIFRLRNLYVEVSDLKLEGKEAFDYCALSPAGSILEVDLETLKDRILFMRPGLKSVSLKKEYPDTIRVFVKERTALAQVEGEGVFIVDEDGFVLGRPRENIDSKLPVINGISSSGLKEGNFSKAKALKKAVEIIKLVEETGFKDKYGLEKIDVSNIDNVSVYFQKGIEVKMGKGDFRNKIRKLEARLSALDLSRIRYIDVRFKDLIVGPK